MRAVYVMALAILLYILGRWIHSKPALSVKSVAGGAFALLFIAVLDQGRTADIASGLAWLFFLAVFLGPNSPIQGIVDLINGKTSPTGLTKKQRAIGRGGPDTTKNPKAG